MYKKKSSFRGLGYPLMNDKWAAASAQEGQEGEKTVAWGMDLMVWAWVEYEKSKDETGRGNETARKKLEDKGKPNKIEEGY